MKTKIFKTYYESVKHGSSKSEAIEEAIEVSNGMTKAQVKEIIAEESLKLIPIHTLTSRSNMRSLCYGVGIKLRKQYFCMVEPKHKKGEAVKQIQEPVKLVHDYGFVFNDGFEICEVDKSVFKMFDSIEIIEVARKHDSRL